MDETTRLLHRFLEQTVRDRNWGHGGLVKALEGVDVRQARWRPGPRMHSIWQLMNHIAYWSRFCVDALDGKVRRAPQRWPAGGLTAAKWTRALESTMRLHDALLARIDRLPPGRLSQLTPGAPFTWGDLLFGCVAHISYHIGQITHVRRLYEVQRGREVSGMRPGG